VHDNAPVAEEGRLTLLCGGVELEVGFLKRGASGVDRAVLPRDITDLTGFRLRGVAGRRFPAKVRVEMAKSACAVAIGRDGGDVDVVN
jgi:hypothetical protein